MADGALGPTKADTNHSDVRRAQLKTAATLRAKFNHEVALRRIDYKLDVIEPEVKNVAIEAVTIGELPQWSVEEDGTEE